MTDSQFFDIDIILAEEEIVQNEMLLDAYDLDSLEYKILSLNGIEEEIEKKEQDEEISENSEEEENYNNYMLNGTIFKSSIWLSLNLAQFNFVKIQTPKWYQKKNLTIMLTDPIISNLREKNLNFFIFGSILSKKLKNFSINETLKEIYLERLKKIILLVLFQSDNAKNSFLNKLDNLENEFYEYSKKCIIEYRLWKTGSLLKYKTHTALARKRIKKN